MSLGLIALAVRRPIGVAVVCAAICVLGWIAVTRLPVDLLPEVDYPRISIITNYPGVGPEEIENLLTRPIEQAVSTIDGVTEITAESAEGMSRVQLQFEWGANLDSAVNDVRAQLDRQRAALPEDAEQPVVLKFDISATPIATLGLSGSGDPRRLRQLADEILTRRLERTPGIASVEVRGGRVREIRVELNLARLVALSVTADQVVSALASDNRNVAAGDMAEAGREVLIRTLGELETTEDIENVLVTRSTGSRAGAASGDSGRPIYVRDVATVTDGFQEIKSEQWVDGEPGIVMRVRKQAGSNTVEVVERLREELQRINQEQAGRARVTLVNNGADYIKSAITNVRSSALYGALLAILVLLFFLRDLRATLVIALSIPLSIAATFALMYFSNYSLNLISFGGLALGIGMLVDNAIVILESIYRKSEEGIDSKTAAVIGAEEVSGAIVAGTLTTIAVFAPVVFLGGFAGVFFAEMAMVVVFALACSLLVATTLVPTLAARLVGRNKSSGFTARLARRLEQWLTALEGAYVRILKSSLRARWLTLAGSVVVLLGAYRLVSWVDVELMPQTDEGVVDLDFELPVGTPIERTREVVLELERRIHRVVRPEEILNMVSSAGPDNPYRPSGSHEGEVELTLVPVSERERGSATIVSAMRDVALGIPDIKLRLRQRTTNPLQRFMRGSQGERLVVEIRGHDLGIAEELGKRVEQLMKKVPGIEDVRVGSEEGLEERSILVHTARAADVSLTRREIAETLETYVLGRVATRLRSAGDEFDVRVMLREEDRKQTAQLANLPILSPNGVVPLSQVAEISARRGPASIQRQGQERVLAVVGGLGERPLSAVVKDLQASIASLAVPAGFSIELAGESREQQKTFAGLSVGIALALLLVFAVMAVQFESLKYPLIVMSAVPFGFVGVVLTLLATQTTFSLNAFLGSIVLVGIVVNNAIVLVDTATLLRSQGLDAASAIVEAGRRRLRPILMTTLTTILAMLPIAIAFGEGSEIQAPLARVLLGGLAASTGITLVLLPVLYMLVDRYAASGKAGSRSQPSFASTTPT